MILFFFEFKRVSYAEKERRESGRQVKIDTAKCRKVNELFTNDSLAKATRFFIRNLPQGLVLKVTYL